MTIDTTQPTPEEEAFASLESKAHWSEADEERMDVVSTNGNDGLHYASSVGVETGATATDLQARIKQLEDAVRFGRSRLIAFSGDYSATELLRRAGMEEQG